MAIYKRGKFYWYEIIFQGQRIRKSAHTDKKTVARAAEADHRRRLEMTLAGMPIEDTSKRVRTVAATVAAYLEDYKLGHRQKSILSAEGRLKQVCLKLGPVMLHELTEAKVREYQRARLADEVSGRTVNMELGDLSRAIGKPWKTLWPKVKKLEESKEVGRALSPEEERRLLDACDMQESPNRSRTLGMFVRLSLMTGMRAGEIKDLQWGRIDLEKGTIQVGIAKTAGGSGRLIPMNPNLRAVLEQYAAWYAERFGPLEQWWYLFPWGKPTPSDPTRPITDITGAWDALRERAGVQCRFHDLRHTAATKMAEAGVPESSMLAIMGHMSRKMLERYSHISMEGKRRAAECLTLPEGVGLPKLPSTNSPTRAKSQKIN
jgi:integrase